jgi:hypothetical protein
MAPLNEQDEQAMTPAFKDEAIPESCQNREKLQREQQLADVLSQMRAEPISSGLQDYFTELNKRIPRFDINSLIEGVKRCAAELPRSGLHNPNSFRKHWKKSNPGHPITISDRHIWLQCPRSWVHEIRKGHRWVLIYQKEVPLSQGLNELLQGPTTLDCGMFCQLLVWMAIRYLIGDKLFDNLFKFKAGQFILTQKWDKPMNEAGSMGNLLYYFYDDPRKMTDESLKPSIQTKTAYNYPKYPAKHLGGMGKLQNYTQIDDDIIIFDPESTKQILPLGELDQKLRQTYNTPQDFADREKLEFYIESPAEALLSPFTNKSVEAIADTAKTLANHTLSDTEWKDSRDERTSREKGLHLVLNFQRLINCLKDAQEAYAEGGYTDHDILYQAESAQRRYLIARRTMIFGF